MKPSPITRLLESPIDTGDAPNLIPRSTHQAVDKLAHPGMPDRHANKLATTAYRRAYERLVRYLGLEHGEVDVHTIMGALMQAAQEIPELEASHEYELETGAIDLVLSLPEFEAAAQAVEAGTLRLEAVLVTEGADIGGAAPEPEADDNPDLEVPEVAQELQAEVYKRRLINMCIQGNAVNKFELYHLAKEKLDAIDPRLMKLYGVVTAAGQMGYWVMPDMLGGPGGPGGENKPAGSVRIEVQGETTVIKAEGSNFPLLIHELVKGLMEFLSYPEDEDAETRKRVMNQADTLAQEPMDIRLGPALWQQIADEIGTANQRLMPHVYDKIVRMPSSKFHTFMKGLLAGEARAKQELQALVKQSKSEASESAGRVAANLLD